MYKIICHDGTEVLLSPDKFGIAKEYKWYVQKQKTGHITIVSYGKERKLSFTYIVFAVNNKTHRIFHKNNNYFDFTNENIIRPVPKS